MSETPVDFQRAAREPQVLSWQGKALPNTTEGEKGVLGSILVDPKASGECIDACEERFRGQGGSFFYDLRHSAVYQVIQDCYRKTHIVDVIAVVDGLRRTGQLEAVGGLSYVCALPDCVPSAANLGYYLDRLCECHALRKLIGTCCEYMGRAYEPVADVDRFIEEFEQDAMRLSAFRQNNAREATAADFIVRHHERLEAGWRAEGGLQTGLSGLDRLLGGMERGEVIVLGAAPSVGKTALACNILSEQLRKRIPCAFFSLEMRGELIVARLASEQSGVPLQRARREKLEGEDFDRYSTASRIVSCWPLRICDESTQTVSQVRSRLRRYKAEHRIEFAAVDYLQLVEPGVRANTRNDAITHISRQLKAAAMELEIPLLVLAQLSRDHRKANRLPSLYDLRESGAIEADADKVILLHPKDDDVLALVEKNRNEARGTCRLQFDAPIFRFHEQQPTDPGI